MLDVDCTACIGVDKSDSVETDLPAGDTGEDVEGLWGCLEPL